MKAKEMGEQLPSQVEDLAADVAARGPAAFPDQASPPPPHGGEVDGHGERSVYASGVYRFIPPVLYQWPEFTSRSEHELATLFIDVAGFTSLSEALAALGDEGAEILERTIARYFDALLESIEAYHGMPIKVSGDALTVVFPNLEGDIGKTALRALACASALRRAGESVCTVPLPSKTYYLAHKIGVGVGRMIGGEVGDAIFRKEYVFAGSALDSAVAAEHHAKGGQVWICPEVRTLLDVLLPNPAMHGWWYEGAHGFFQLSDDAMPHEHFPSRDFHLPPLGQLPSEEEFNERFLPMIAPAVREHATKSKTDYLCRHQSITVMFVSCPDLKIDTPADLIPLDAHYKRMQLTIEQFGGFLSEFEAGDKGSKLIVLFGAPSTLEDSCGQAARCANAMQEAAREQGIIRDQRIGMSSGKLYVGRIGCRSLVKYSALGDRMNLAARLMGAAGRWNVLAERQATKGTQRHARWGNTRTLKVKGREEPVSVSSLQRPRKAPGLERRGRGILERKSEQQAISRLINNLRQGTGSILMVDGAPGLGKTRLMEYVRRMAAEGDPISCLTWNGAPILTASPLSAWRPLLEDLMGLRNRHSQEEALVLFEQWIKSLPEELQRSATLLAPLVQLQVPLDPVLESLPADQLFLFRQRAMVECVMHSARTQPRVLILDGAEKIDGPSAQVLVELSALLGDLALGVVIAARPAAQASLDPLAGLRARPGLTRLVLKPLSEKQAGVLVQKRLKVKTLDPELLELLYGKTSGNPLLLESWADMLLDQGLVRVLNDVAFLRGTRRVNSLPDKLEAMVLTQLERLPPEAQLTMRVASVISLPFTAAQVAALHPESPDVATVTSHLQAGNQVDLLWYDRGRAGYMMFTRAEVREAIHDSMPFTLRRTLHARRATQLVEQEDVGTDLDLQLLLASHYEYIEDPAAQADAFHRAMTISRERFEHGNALRWGRKVVQTARACARRDLMFDAYAVMSVALSKMGEADERLTILNQWVEEARAQGLEDIPSHIAALIQRFNTLNRQGKTDEALSDLRAAQELARTSDARLQETEILVSMAMFYGEHGNGAQAVAQIEEALSRYPGGNPDLLMRIHSNRGFALNQVSRPADAHAAFLQALQLSEQAGDVWAQAVLVGNLGIELWSMGYPQQGHESLMKALELKRKVGDRREIGLTLNNICFSYSRLGELSKARTYAEEACQVFARLGYVRGQLYAASNLGEILWLLGHLDEAEKALTEASLLLVRSPHVVLQLELEMRWAELLLSQGKLAEVQKRCEEVLKLTTNPNRAAYRCNALEAKAMVLLAEGKASDALVCIEEALELLSNGAELTYPQRLWWRACQVYVALEKLSEADRCVRKGLELLEQEQKRLEGATARHRLARAWPWTQELVAWKRSNSPKERPPDKMVAA